MKKSLIDWNIACTLAHDLGLHNTLFFYKISVKNQSIINNLFNNFILSMEDSLNETNDKENTDENQRKTTKSSLEQQCTSHTTEFRTPSGN